MKTVLVQERDLSDRDLKKLSHAIDDLAVECFGETGMEEFEDVAKEASTFPEVSARYDGDERAPKEVWAAARIAQRAASGFARRYSDRNIRSQVLRSATR